MEINKEHKSTKKDLRNYYDYVYSCNKCKRNYGSNDEELGINLCPDCDPKY